MTSITGERKVVWLGAADGLVQVRAGIAKLATVPESVAREAELDLFRRLRGHPGTIANAAALDLYNGPRTDRAARRARQFGRVLR